jgi:hypothetical protein
MERLLRGSPVQVADQVIATSVSTDGTLVFRSGADPGRELAWFGRSGKEVSRPSGPGNSPSLSPDGKRVALGRVAPGATRPDIWILDLARDVFSPVTASPGVHNSPLWSPMAQTSSSLPRGSANPSFCTSDRPLAVGTNGSCWRTPGA